MSRHLIVVHPRRHDCGSAHRSRAHSLQQGSVHTRAALPSLFRCLENRYHEKVADANAAGDWACPRCRGECNCSNCRKASGARAELARPLGACILAHLWQLMSSASCCRTLRCTCSSAPCIRRRTSAARRAAHASAVCTAGGIPTPAAPAPLCREVQKAGKEATGQLANIAKKAGFGSGGCSAWAVNLVKFSAVPGLLGWASGAVTRHTRCLLVLLPAPTWFSNNLAFRSYLCPPPPPCPSA